MKIHLLPFFFIEYCAAMCTYPQMENFTGTTCVLRDTYLNNNVNERKDLYTYFHSFFFLKNAIKYLNNNISINEIPKLILFFY